MVHKNNLFCNMINISNDKYKEYELPKIIFKEEISRIKKKSNKQYCNGCKNKDADDIMKLSDEPVGVNHILDKFIV